MQNLKLVKDTLCLAVGTFGAFIAQIFGGWDAAMTTLCICMVIDYATGLIVAGVFHKSGKSADGTLESRAGWKGLVRKGVTLLVVLIACRLDIQLGTHLIKDTVVITFIANEILSIAENAGLMGVPMPRIITSAIHVLKVDAERNADTVEQLAEKKKRDPMQDEDINDPEG